MRYWGKNIEIDGSFYNTAMGKNLLPTPAEMAQLKAAGNYYQHEGDVGFYEETVQTMLKQIDRENSVGQILIDAINRTPKTLRIIPLTGKEQMKGKNFQANCVGSYNQQGNDCVIWYEPWSKMPAVLAPPEILRIRCWSTNCSTPLGRCVGSFI